MSQNISLHENYRDEEPIEAGSDRAFGCTVGSIFIVIGTAKAVAAGALPPITCSIFAVGAVLLLLGIFAPSRLSVLNRILVEARRCNCESSQSDRPGAFVLCCGNPDGVCCTHSR